MTAHDKQYEVGGVFRCCIQSLVDVVLPETVEPGYVVPCQWCHGDMSGMRWTGKVWRGKWVDEKKQAVTP